MTTKTTTTTRDIETLEALELDDAKLDFDVEIVKRKVVAATPSEEADEPKSLHELWVENGRKFPFTAVKVAETGGIVPLGNPILLTGTSVAGGFVWNGIQSDPATIHIKAWKFA